MKNKFFEFSKPLISIIVTVFNLQEYIFECLNSIMVQSFKDFEVIIIDDGSTDDTLLILEYFCKNDPRFKYYSIQNNGVSNARNIGINYSIGKYITFIDGDDAFHPEILNNFYLLEKKFNVELYEFSFWIGKKYFPLNIKNVNHSLIIYSKDHTPSSKYFRKAIWGKFYLASIIKDYNLEFLNFLSIGEDFHFYSLYISRINTILVNKSKFYFYRLRNNSLSSNTKNKINKITDNFIAHKIIFEYFATRNTYHFYLIEYVASLISFFSINKTKTCMEFRIIKAKINKRKLFFSNRIDFFSKLKLLFIWLIGLNLY